MSPRFCFLCIVGYALILVHETELAPVASTYQVLPPRPGYIPVYIRRGDVPLEEINLELAEAFRSLESKSSHDKVPQDKSQFILTGIVEDGKTKFDYIPTDNEILKNIGVQK